MHLTIRVLGKGCNSWRTSSPVFYLSGIHPTPHHHQSKDKGNRISAHPPHDLLHRLILWFCDLSVCIALKLHVSGVYYFRIQHRVDRQSDRQTTRVSK